MAKNHSKPIATPPASNPRSTNGAKRRKVKRILRAQRGRCHLCGYAINYEAHHLDPLAFEVDEVIPISKGGSPYNLTNCRPSHRCCNQWRSNRDLTAALKKEIRARYERTYAKKKNEPPKTIEQVTEW